MWWRSPRLDRIEHNMEQMQQSIQDLAEISQATNRRIDRFVAEMREGYVRQQERTDQLQRGVEQLQQGVGQLQRAMEYLLSKDG